MRLLALAVIFSMTSCATKYYAYEIQMEKPVPSKTLNYEDSVMSITFEFDQKWIDFNLYNKSEDGIKILWDELSMSENGKALRIVHKNTGTTRITDVQPPTSVPPKSRMDDQLIPSSNISYSRYSGITQLNLKSLYPTSDGGDKKKRQQILSKKGEKVVIYFPYYIKNQYQSKNFEFLIVDVTPRKKKK